MLSLGKQIAVAFLLLLLPNFGHNQAVHLLFCSRFPSLETVPKQSLISIKTVQKEDKSIPCFFLPLYFCAVFQSQPIGAHIATAEKTSNRKSNPLTKKGKTQWQKSLE